MTAALNSSGNSARALVATVLARPALEKAPTCIAHVLLTGAGAAAGPTFWEVGEGCTIGDAIG